MRTHVVLSHPEKFNIALAEQVLDTISIDGRHDQGNCSECVIGWASRHAGFDHQKLGDHFGTGVAALGLSVEEAYPIWGTFRNKRARRLLKSLIRQHRAWAARQVDQVERYANQQQPVDA